MAMRPYMVSHDAPPPGEAQLTRTRIELKKPCGQGYNLSNCKKFAQGQPNGAASWPALSPVKWAPRGNCPRCDKHSKYDMDKVRMIRVRAVGWKAGLGPSKDDIGFDVLCCSVM